MSIFPESRQPESRRGVYGRVVELMGRNIASGYLEVGTLLPTDSLCQEFDVSRTVIREAVRVLEAKGLLSVRPGRPGTRIRPMSDWNLTDHDVIVWRLSGSQAGQQKRELQELHHALQSMAVRSTVGRLGNPVQQELKESLASMSRAVTDGDAEAYAGGDARLHGALLHATGNRMVAQLWHMANTTMGESGSPANLCALPTPSAVTEHARLVRALCAGDADSAEAALQALTTTALQPTGI